MKLIYILFLFLSMESFSQSFGQVAIAVAASPKNEKDMLFYCWYLHPKEKDIYIMNCETNLKGFDYAFDTLLDLLSQNSLSFENYFKDQSTFHPTLDSVHAPQELNASIQKGESKIFRTWNASHDYLTLLLNKDAYVLILGSNRPRE